MDRPFLLPGWLMLLLAPVALPAAQPRGTLTGHTEVVLCVALSADGKVLASGSRDATIKLWDVATMKERATLKGHTGDVVSLAFTPDGKRLVSAGDRTVRVWDVAGRKAAAVLKGHALPVDCVAVHPGGKWAASGGTGRTIRLWSLTTFKERSTFAGHTDGVTVLAFSKDGNTLFSGSGDRTIKAWNVRSGEEVATLKGHKAEVRHLAVSRDGARLVSAEAGTLSLRLWDTEALAPVRGLPQPRRSGGRGKEVRGLALGPEKALLTGDRDGRITLRSIEGGEGDSWYAGGAGPIRALAFNAITGTIVVSQDRVIHVWGVFMPPSLLAASVLGSRSPNALTTVAAACAALAAQRGSRPPEDREPRYRAHGEPPLQGHGSVIEALALNPDGKTLASASDDGTARLWDVRTGKPKVVLRRHTGNVLAVAWSKDGKRLATAGQDRTIRLWDDKGNYLGAIEGHTDAVHAVAFHPNGKLLVTGSADRTIRFWGLATRKPVRTVLRGHTKTVTSLVFTPDRRTLLSGGDDGLILLWDMAGPRWKGTLRGHTHGDAVWGGLFLAVTPDGKSFVSVGLDGYVRLWDLATRRETAYRLLSHHWYTGTNRLGVAISRDGKALAVSHFRGTVKVWDLPTLEERVEIRALPRALCVAITDDGRGVFAGSSDLVQRWQVFPRGGN